MAKQDAARSYWIESGFVEPAPRLDSPLETDVLIVGAGLTGITLAYELTKRGHRTAVVDSGAILNGETGRTTAHVTWALDSGYHDIESLHGRKTASLVLESQQAAVRKIARLVEEESIDCDFRRLDAYFFPHAEDGAQLVEEEHETLRKLGAQGVERVESTPVGALRGPALRYSGQALFHPIKFAAALARAAKSRGAAFYENTHVEKIERGRARASSGAEIRARAIVVATHSPIKNPLFFVKEAAYRSYVVASRVKAGSVPSALFWDTDDPYHYVRLHPLGGGEDLLIVGGEDHKTGQPEEDSDPFAELEKWAREHFESYRETEYRWSGQIVEPVDSLAFIGKSPGNEGVFLATGYSGNGMTYAMVASTLLADLVAGKENPWARAYDPARKNPNSTGELLKENLNVAKRMVADRVRGGDIDDPNELAEGEGAVLGDGPNKMAVYRDEAGVLHEHSATCTHLRCVVQWNDVEKSFDCPCHGSRFNGKGEVICGPATQSLRAASTSESSRTSRPRA